MTLRDRLLGVLNQTAPSWMADNNGILGKPVTVPDSVLRPPIPPQPPLPHTNLAKNNQSVAFVGNLGGGEKIAKAGGPDILLKTLTSSDDSIVITTSNDGNEVDFVAADPNVQPTDYIISGVLYRVDVVYTSKSLL